MDPTEDPDDILRANRSRERTYVFDHTFGGHADQVCCLFSLCAVLVVAAVAINLFNMVVLSLAAAINLFNMVVLSLAAAINLFNMAVLSSAAAISVMITYRLSGHRTIYFLVFTNY